MLEFLRKHQYGLMLVVAILTIIAFVFLYDKNTYSQGSVQRGTAFKVYGKGYGANYLQKLDSYFNLAQELGMQDLAMQLAGSRIVDNRLPLDFPINLMILRKEGRELGISPSNEEARKELEGLRAFADASGRFDPTIFAARSKSLSERNIKDADLMQIMRDKITLDRVKELLASNFQPPVTEVEDVYAENNEEITAYALKRSLEDFSKDVTVSDEEIAARYEEDKETLLSEEKRKIEYVHFQAPIFPKPTPAAIPSSIDLSNPGGTLRNDPTSLLPPSKPAVTEGLPSIIDDLPAVDPDGGEEAPVEPAGDADAVEDAVEGEEDTCGAPQDEPAVEDETEGADEALGDVVEELNEAADEAVDAQAAEAASSLAEEIAETVETADGELAAPEPAAPTPGAPNPIPPNVTAPTPAAPMVSPEEQKLAKREFVTAVNTEYSAARGDDGSVDLEKLGEAFIAAAAGKKFSGTFTTTELFTREEAPQFLKDTRPGRNNRNPIDLIFTAKEGQVSAPEKLSIDDREDWFIFRVLEIVEPKQLSLEEAREQIVETLKDEKARAALEAALEEDAKKIQTEMAGKNSFKDSADKLGIEYSRHYKYVGQPKPEDIGTFFGYKDLIDSTVPGNFSEPKIAGETGYLVYVAAKELADDPAANNKKLTISDQLMDGVKYQQYTVSPGYGDQIFKAWLEDAYEKAEPSRKY
ncbi:MAG: SurA N-terminal domain-containing protein [Verrucomicrobiales bacterium]